MNVTYDTGQTPCSFEHYLFKLNFCSVYPTHTYTVSSNGVKTMCVHFADMVPAKLRSLYLSQCGVIGYAVNDCTRESPTLPRRGL